MSILRYSLLLLSFCACTNDAVSTRKDAALPPFTQDANGPNVAVWVDSPQHLLSNVPSDIQISLHVDYMTTRDVSFDRVVKATAISNWDTKTAIPGKWSQNGYASGPYYAVFTPTGSLPVGEYLIEITSSDELGVVGNSRTRFHVGSLPRVRELRFASSAGKPAPIDIIDPIFSEIMDLSNLSQNLVVERSVNSNWTVSSFKTGTTTLISALSATDEIRVTVKKGVMSKTNVALDGLYKGIPGSGDFVATFKYKDIDSGTMIWTPKVP